VGLETGLTFGAGDGDDFGGEVGPDLFFDVPLTWAAMRSYLTLSLGFRAGVTDHPVALAGTTVERLYFMPVIRLGYAFGR